MKRKEWWGGLILETQLHRPTVTSIRFRGGNNNPQIQEGTVRINDVGIVVASM